VRIARQTKLSSLANQDFYALLDGSRLVRFNNKGFSDGRIALYRELGEKVASLGTPPYYYSSIIKSYLHRFETISAENSKIR